MLKGLRAALRILGLGLLMAALNLLPLSASTMVAAHAETGLMSISSAHHSDMTADMVGDNYRDAEATVSDHDQTPCNDHDASHGKLDCCLGVHCAAGYAVVAPFDQQPLMPEPQPILLPKSLTILASVGVGAILEPPRLSI